MSPGTQRASVRSKMKKKNKDKNGTHKSKALLCFRERHFGYMTEEQMDSDPGTKIQPSDKSLCLGATNPLPLNVKD